LTTAIVCYDCDAAMIQGVFCHESGCPSSWRDVRRECRVCGYGFKPAAQAETVCADCHETDLLDLFG
jgi:hypothetical protein